MTRPAPFAAALAAGVVFGAGLAGCRAATPQDDAQKIGACANQAAEYLDPNWEPRQATGVYPDADGGVQAVITGPGVQVRVTCGVVYGYYMHVVTGVAAIEGVEPAPGQLYLPGRHRWLTADELHARLTALLAPRAGEYAGAPWAPNSPAVYTISDMARIASTSCFTLQSRLEPARQLVACEEPVGHRYFVNQGTLALELLIPPKGLPRVPPAPPPDWSTQPAGKPFAPDPP